MTPLIPSNLSAAFDTIGGGILLDGCWGWVFESVPILISTADSRMHEITQGDYLELWIEGITDMWMIPLSTFHQIQIKLRVPLQESTG